MKRCCTTTDENAVAKCDKLQLVERFAIEAARQTEVCRTSCRRYNLRGHFQNRKMWEKKIEQQSVNLIFLSHIFLSICSVASHVTYRFSLNYENVSHDF